MNLINNKFKIFFLLLLVRNIFAQELDLSGIEKSNIREEMKPVLSVLVCQNEVPSPIVSFSSSRKLLFGAKLVNGYKTYDKSQGLIIPSFFCGIVISSNLSIIGQISNGKWKNDNIENFGSAFNYTWGEEEKKGFFTFRVNHLNGPDDFHMRDIGFTYGKYFIKKHFEYFYGISSHYLRVKVHIDDCADPLDNFQKVKKSTLYHLRAGIFKNVNILKIGTEIDLSPELVMINFILSGIL